MIVLFSPGSGVSSRVLSKVNTMPAEISPTNKSGSSPDQFKLERSKTERQRHLRPEDAAQIFDEKIPVKEKVYLIKELSFYFMSLYYPILKIFQIIFPFLQFF